MGGRKGATNHQKNLGAQGKEENPGAADAVDAGVERRE